VESSRLGGWQQPQGRFRYVWRALNPPCALLLWAATLVPATALVVGVGTATVATTSTAFDLQGHRGARGLAPENTLVAFAKALEIGVTTLELDLAMTRDRVLVIAHDPRLNPNFTRDAKGQWLTVPGPSIQSLSLAELQSHDVGRLQAGTAYAKNFPDQVPSDGQTVPTLEALFDLVKHRGPTRVRFNIEPKTNPTAPDLTASPEDFVRALLRVLDRHGLRSRVTVESFDWRSLRVVQRLAPDIKTVALTTRQSPPYNLADPRWTDGLTLQASGGSTPKMVKQLGAQTWSPHQGDLSQALVDEAHALGLTVIPWTVNDPAAMDRFLSWGVDGLISDHPQRVRSAMQRRGLALPVP
jgi:glycerophosphoryl diester phosphodiesterase